MGGTRFVSFWGWKGRKGAFPRVNENNEFVKMQEEMRKGLVVRARDAGAEGDGK